MYHQDNFSGLNRFGAVPVEHNDFVAPGRLGRSVDGRDTLRDHDYYDEMSEQEERSRGGGLPPRGGPNPHYRSSAVPTRWGSSSNYSNDRGDPCYPASSKCS